MIVVPRWDAFSVEAWKANRVPRGTWHLYPIADPTYLPLHGLRVVGDVRGVVHINCPECGKLFLLSPVVHQIGADGSISPSVVCPHRPCGWHVFAKLAGWPP